MTEIQKKNDANKWRDTAERFVCFIDIMGFKDWVAREEHDIIYQAMRNVSKAVAATLSVFTVDDELEDDDSFDNIWITTFSDSIVVFSKDSRLHTFDNFIGAITTLTDSLFEYGIPHKGAIAFGKMTVDFPNNIFFGQPLIDAYYLEEELAFYGIVMHASAEFIYDVEDDESILRYQCPFKTATANHLTVVPSVSISDEFDEVKFDKLKTNVENLRKKTSGGLRKYIDNTLAYLDFMEKEAKKFCDLNIEEEK